MLDASGAWSKRSEGACILRMNNAGVELTSWVSVAAELLHDHLGLYKKPVQGVFDKYLFGYSAATAQTAWRRKIAGTVRYSLTLERSAQVSSPVSE